LKLKLLGIIEVKTTGTWYWINIQMLLSRMP